MTQELFSSLSRAVEGAPFVAFGAAFVWGVLSIVLSPCHLASLPLIVGFISGQGKLSVRQTFGTSLLFAVGLLVTIASVGAVTAGAGRMMGDIGKWGNYAMALIFFAVGLHLLGVISLPLSSASQPAIKSRGLFAAFMLGLVFGIALGPCTFAYMAPMLAVTFKLAKSAWMYGALLLLAYGVGHCAVIVVAGSSTQVVQRYLDWNERSKAMNVVKIVCGILVLLGGLYLIYAAR